MSTVLQLGEVMVLPVGSTVYAADALFMGATA